MVVWLVGIFCGRARRRQVVLEADVTPLSLAPPRTSLNSEIHRRVHRAALEARAEREIDDRLVAVVERMFDRCFADGQYRQAIGVALETRRLDKLEEAITKSPDAADSLAYATKVCQTLVTSREFRREVLHASGSAIRGDGGDGPTSTCASASCSWTTRTGLPPSSENSSPEARAAAFVVSDRVLVVRERDPGVSQPRQRKVGGGACDGGGSDAEKKRARATLRRGSEEKKEEKPTAATPMSLLRSVLSGELPVGLHLEFLFSHNAADLLLLKQIRTAVESRNSVCHSATVLCNALMHAGTTVDTFLRENLDWLSRATNWARFSATAGMGVIHHGQLAERTLMGPFLPRESGSGGMRPLTLHRGRRAVRARSHPRQPRRRHSSIPPRLEPVEQQRGNSARCFPPGRASPRSARATRSLHRPVPHPAHGRAVAGEGAGIGMGLLLAGTGPTEQTAADSRPRIDAAREDHPRVQRRTGTHRVRVGGGGGAPRGADGEGL